MLLKGNTSRILKGDFKCSQVGIRSVQSFSHIQLFATPWTVACQASLSTINFQSLLKLMFIELVMHSSTQEKGAVTSQETDPDLPMSVQEYPVEVWVIAGLLQGQGPWVCLLTFWRGLPLSRASLIAQFVKNPPAMQEKPVQFPDWEGPLKKG